jgi:hypothetical protein
VRRRIVDDKVTQKPPSIPGYMANHSYESRIGRAVCKAHSPFLMETQWPWRLTCKHQERGLSLYLGNNGLCQKVEDSIVWAALILRRMPDPVLDTVDK